MKRFLLFSILVTIASGSSASCQYWDFNGIWNAQFALADGSQGVCEIVIDNGGQRIRDLSQLTGQTSDCTIFTTTGFQTDQSTINGVTTLNVSECILTFNIDFTILGFSSSATAFGNMNRSRDVVNGVLSDGTSVTRLTMTKYE